MKQQLLRKSFLGFLIAITFYLSAAEALCAQDSWNNGAQFPGGARNRAVGFSIGTKGYFSTGFDLNTDDFSDLWEYDQPSGTWTQKANFAGSPRRSAVAFSIGSKGYIGTGYGYNFGEYSTFSDFWEYDPTANVWTRKADYAGGEVSYAVAFSIGNKGYIGTGTDSAYAIRKDFWEYDPVADSWTRKADFGGGAIAASTAFSIGTNGYVGSDSTLWQWNQATNIWTQKANAPTLFGLAVSFVIGSRGYVYINNGSNTTFLEYNPCSDQWAQKSNQGPTLFAPAAFSIGNYGYLGAGCHGGGANDSAGAHLFWCYTPSSLLSKITTYGITGSPFCAGANLPVSFYANGDGNICNVFTAQLSNSTGSFASPVNIGTLINATSGTYTINAQIPSNTPAGSGYRIRVVSSDPVVVGSDNGIDIIINNCPSILTLNMFIQGYYNAGIMRQVLYNEDVDTNPSSTNVDTVTISLVNPSNGTYVQISKGVLQTNGSLSVTFPDSVIGNSYYIYVKHRNSILTSSSNPVTFSSSTGYDFTTAANKAFGNNMIQVQSGVWAIYTGDITRDGYIDHFDFPPYDTDCSIQLTGVYQDAQGYSTDLDGDGNVDPFDFPIYDVNNSNQVSANVPW